MDKQSWVQVRPVWKDLFDRVMGTPLDRLERMPDRYFGFLLLLPAIIMVSVLFAYPLVYTIVGSLQDRDPFGGPSPFVGLTQYRTLLSDPAFWNAFQNGLVYAVSTVLLQVLVGVGIALLLHQPFRGNLVARTMLILPYIMAPVGAALVWKWLLNDILGLVNYVLIQLGLTGRPIAFLGSTQWAMKSVIGISVWKLFPFVTIPVLARLQTIPTELYDAAKVDGAGPVSSFFYITLPQLRGVLFIVILLRSIWMFNNFEMIWLLTKGGPVNHTTTLPILAYIEAFTGGFEISLGMAITTVMVLFLILVAVVYFRLYNIEEEIA